MLEGFEAGFEVDKFEVEVEVAGQGLQDPTTRWNDFFANPVTRDEACIVRLEVRGGAVEMDGPVKPYLFVVYGQTSCYLPRQNVLLTSK